jgi:hypothetical protein
MHPQTADRRHAMSPLKEALNQHALQNNQKTTKKQPKTLSNFFP